MKMTKSKKYSHHRNQHLSGAIVASLCLGSGRAFLNQPTRAPVRPSKQGTLLFMADEWKDTSNDANLWRSSDDVYEEKEDWREMLARKNDGSFWSEFEPSADGDEASSAIIDTETEDIDDADIWLDTLASISADEIEFNVCNKVAYPVLSFFLFSETAVCKKLTFSSFSSFQMVEAERADKVRQMQEWGFDDATVTNTFGVAVDDSLEKDGMVEGMQEYREMGYLDDEDWKTVESHTKVEKDPETGEPIRQQMVYVDEHTCIGCTNCAMIAQSTFLMDEEHGRARVFSQWGDDDETIQIAIETCPVDCIHYVPYDELVRLEVERRGQNINFKARLVSQGEYGGLGLSHRVGGPNAFTAPQKISGNLGSRCNNCPSRGCRDCPMFGVGKNPEFERKEKERKAKIERRRLQQQREDEKKSADL